MAIGLHIVASDERRGNVFAEIHFERAFGRGIKAGRGVSHRNGASPKD
jgi:hypothetical protein